VLIEGIKQNFITQPGRTETKKILSYDSLYIISI